MKKIGFKKRDSRQKVKVNDDGSRVVNIVCTTDIHGNLWGYSYEDNRESSNSGMSRISEYVNRLRKDNPGNVVLIDNGDILQGSILTDDIFNRAKGKHPVISAMNYMGYDAMILGNHEFDYGETMVNKLKKQAAFPILAGNVEYMNGKKLVDATTVVELDGLKIGIVGITNPDVPRWVGEQVKDLRFSPVTEEFTQHYDSLSSECDFVMVCAHVGFNPEYDEDYGTDGGKALIEARPDIRALMVGHTHFQLQRTEGNTEVLSCVNSAREIAQFDVTFDKDNKVVDVKGHIVDMAKSQPDLELRNLSFVRKAHLATMGYVTGSDKGLKKYRGKGGIFGRATCTFQPEDEIKGIPEGLLRDTAVVDLINKIQLEKSGADISAACLFKDSSNIKEGDINYGTVFDIYKFDNVLYRVKITGRELKNYMEWSAELYNQWQVGDMSISFNPEHPIFLYDIFAGVDYKIDISKPNGQRIQDVMVKGRPVGDDDVFKLAVSHYRYSSTLKTMGIVAAKRDWESNQSVRDMIVSYIQEHKVISPEIFNNWSIVGAEIESPFRTRVIQMVNNGELEIPYHHSLNVFELREKGII